MPLIELPIMPQQHNNHKDQSCDRQRGKAHASRKSSGVPRGLCGDEDITCHEVGRVANSELDGARDGLLGSAAQIAIEPADEDWELHEGSECDDIQGKVSNAWWLHLLELDDPADKSKDLTS